MYLIKRYIAISKAKKILEQELKLGVPFSVSRKSGKYKRFDKPYYGSAWSWITYRVFDERLFTFEVQYKKNKTVSFVITAKGLDLSYSQNGMRMIKEQYNHYNFTFNKYETSISYTQTYVKNIDEFISIIKSEINTWNNSGLYNLLLELHKIK